MRFTRTVAFLIGLSLSSIAAAANSRDAMLVSVEWLAQHIEDRNLVLFHVGPPAEYDARHLPGARLVSLSDIALSDPTRKGLRLEMPPPDDLRRRLEALGISQDSRIIVYFAPGWIAAATRVMFTLDYAGLGDRASMLDGGLDGWIRSGKAVSSVVPPAAPGTLPALKINSSIVDADYVVKNMKAPGVAIVDARTPAFYDGTQTGGSKDAPHKTGHIAGARTVPFITLTTEQQTLRSPEDLRAIFTRAGVNPGDTIVVYCHIGQQATATLFAARTLGHRALLYDGSFEDWSRRDLPVESSSKEPR
jgi:thiosulfate/3-mercaptopyruvate sulfurtransferase